MTDFLAAAYPWTKSLHVVAVIAWMAGLFYLPRLYVYHVERILGMGPEAVELFQTMERRLLKAIINPASIAVWVFGLALVFTPGVVDWSSVWPWTKAGAVIGMTIFHHWLARERKRLERGEPSLGGRGYRIANEVPTLLLVVIVFSVILKF